MGRSEAALYPYGDIRLMVNCKFSMMFGELIDYILKKIDQWYTLFELNIYIFEKNYKGNRKQVEKHIFLI